MTDGFNGRVGHPSVSHSPNHYHNTSGEGHGHCLCVHDIVQVRVQLCQRRVGLGWQGAVVGAVGILFDK